MKKVAFGGKPQTPAKPVTPDEWVNAQNGSNEDSSNDDGPDAAEPMKRLTIDVTASLHRRIKVQCAERDVKIADEVRALLEKHFPEETPSQT